MLLISAGKKLPPSIKLNIIINLYNGGTIEELSPFLPIWMVMTPIVGASTAMD